MNPFLILLGVFLLSVILVGILAAIWLRDKIKTVVESLAQTLQGTQGGVPPFRISLSPTLHPQWTQPETVQTVTSVLEALNYRRVADFEIPEMEGITLRGFWHPQEKIDAVLYDHPQVGVFVDLAQDLETGDHLTASCAPESGLSQPEFARLIRLSLDLKSDPGSVRTLHQELLSARGDRSPRRTTAEEFQQRFTEAYAREMDWRIRRGGITAAEVRQVALMSGQPEPDEVAIQQVQAIWRGGISAFVEEQATQAFLRSTSLSATEWENLRDRIYVVHEQLIAERVIEDLTEQMLADGSEEEVAWEEARRQLHRVFVAPLIRQGFRAAQVLLPESRRYTLLGSVAEPFPADLYVEPPNAEET